MKQNYFNLARCAAAFLLTLFALPAVAQEFSSGSGTASDPYIITNRTQLETELATFAAADITGYYFKLGNDIDLSGADWQILDTWQCSLDGDGHKITGLKINKDAGQTSTTTQSRGFFSKAGRGAVIKNLIFENAQVNITDGAGSANAGALVGYIDARGSVNSDVLIENVHFKNLTLTNNAQKNAYTGGIVGNIRDFSAASITINRCSVQGTISGSLSFAGGIAGLVADATKVGGSTTISNCSTDVDITTTRTTEELVYLGGIVGAPNQIGDGENVYDQIIIEKNLAAGKISAPINKEARLGGIAGFILCTTYASDNLVTLTNNVAAQTTITNPDGRSHRIFGAHSAGGKYVAENNLAYDNLLINGVKETANGDSIGTSKTSAQLMQKATYVALGWDMDNVWDITEGSTMPWLRDFSGTGIQAVAAAQTLKAVAAGGLLKISGYALGQTVTVYNAHGIPVYSRKAAGETVSVKLPAHGVYIVSAGNQKAKVLF
ncbi:MAG: hypothetical protein LBR64_01580 [Dysgonamonadaceae bacterium]|jgi:hypothetical protein|nr:hypothetical protein [Dysgonamonadaceae bacterium]